MRAVIALLLAGLASGAAHAQLFPAPRPDMTWDTDRVVLVEVLAGHRALAFKHPDPKLDFSIRGPKGAYDLRWAEGAAWAVTPPSEAHPEAAWELRQCVDRQSWIRVGHFPKAPDSPAQKARVHPLSQGKFLLMCMEGPPFELGDEASLFALASPTSDGTFKVQSLVDLGLKSPMFTRERRGGRPTWTFNLKHLWLLNAVRNQPFLATPDGLVLGCFQIGAFFVLDGQGRLRRRLDVFPSLTDEMRADTSTFEYVVLCAQPRADGKILLATRSEDAVLHGRKLFPRDHSLATSMDSRKAAERDAFDRLSLSQFPQVLWWELDPLEGVIRPAAPPQQVPTTLQDPAALRRYRFTFKPNGDLDFSPSGGRNPGAGGAGR